MWEERGAIALGGSTFLTEKEWFHNTKKNKGGEWWKIKEKKKKMIEEIEFRSYGEPGETIRLSACCCCFVVLFISGRATTSVEAADGGEKGEKKIEEEQKKEDGATNWVRRIKLCPV